MDASQSKWQIQNPAIHVLSRNPDCPKLLVPLDLHYAAGDVVGTLHLPNELVHSVFIRPSMRPPTSSLVSNGHRVGTFSELPCKRYVRD